MYFAPSEIKPMKHAEKRRAARHCRCFRYSACVKNTDVATSVSVSPTLSTRLRDVRTVRRVRASSPVPFKQMHKQTSCSRVSRQFERFPSRYRLQWNGSYNKHAINSGTRKKKDADRLKGNRGTDDE